MVASCNIPLYAQPPYKPLRTTEKMTLDGKLDEPAWKLVAEEHDFMQDDPIPGGLPSERTELRMVYNDDYLYVGLRAYDRDPSKLISNSVERDFEPGND